MGILGDVSPNRGQPPLADGIHLRWAFERELGFPRYGFYHFRRLSREVESDHACPSHVLGGLPVGRWPSNDLSSPFGRVSSNERLVLTDDFVPSGRVKFDLDGRSHLRCDLRESARSVWVVVGFCEETEIEVSMLSEQTSVAGLTVSGVPSEISPTSAWSDVISVGEFIKEVAELPKRGHTNIRVKWDRKIRATSEWLSHCYQSVPSARVLDDGSTRAG
jgi:hypothetical protein